MSTEPQLETMLETMIIELMLDQLPQGLHTGLIKEFHEELELNVGRALASKLTDQQLEEFEQLIDAGDDSGSSQWLDECCPDHREVVKAQFEMLKKTLASRMDEIFRLVASGELGDDRTTTAGNGLDGTDDDPPNAVTS